MVVDFDHYLTINAAKDEVGVKSLSIKLPYDGKPHGADWEPVNVENLIAGDEIDAKLDGVTVTTPDDGIKSNTFAYARILRDGKTDVTANYSKFTIITGTLEIVNADFRNVTAEPIVKTYDGVETNIEVVVGDTLATNELKVVYSKNGPTGPWVDENPAFKDVVSTTVWYKVSAKYFNDYTGSATVDINKRKLVFKSKDGETTYDSTKPVQIKTDLTPGAITETSASEGIVEGEEDGISFENPKEVTDVTDGVDATYDVAFDGETAKEGNYDVTKTYGTLRVYEQGKLWIRAEDREFKYTGETNTWHKYVPTGLNPGDGIKSVTFDEASRIAKPSEGPVANTITDVVITNSAGENVTGTYDPKYIPGVLTMEKGSLEGLVKAKDIEKVYDAIATNITVEVDKTGLVDSEAEIKITYRTSKNDSWASANPSFVNKIVADVFYRVEVPEYEPYEGQAKLVIRLRPITLLSASAKKMYDGNALATNEVTIVSGTLADGDSDETKEYLTFACTSSQTDVGTAQNKYEYGVTNRLGTADLWKNYDFTLLEGTLTVEPAMLFYKPETYNGPYDNHDHQVYVPQDQIDALPDGATVSYSVDGSTWKTSPEEFKGHDVTNLTVYVRVTAPNHTPETVPVVLNIYKRAITLEGPNKNKQYDGAALTFTGSEIKDGGQRYADGECFAYSDFATITNVGETPSLFKYADNGTAKISNYDVTLITDRYLTIYPSDSAITVKSASAKKEYDGKPLKAGFETFGEDKLAEGDVIDAKIADASSITEPGVVSNLFEYVKIMRDLEEVTDTYTNLVVVTGILEVVNANFDEVKAEPIEKKYDGAPASIEVQVTDPVAEEKGYTILYSTDGVNFTDENPAFTHVCATTVWYAVEADYFNAVTNSTTIEILPRKLVYQSADASKVENGTPLTTGEITLVDAESDGLVEGDEVQLTGTGSVTTYAEGSALATFDVAFTAGEASDYIVEKRYGTLTIYEQGALTFIAGSKAFEYTGDTYTYSMYTMEGTLNEGDAIDSVTIEGTISHPSQSPVDNKITSVVITNAAGETVTGNYTIDYKMGTLTMKKGTLTVTSEGASKTYDAVATNITVTVDTEPMVEAARETVVVKYSVSPKGPFVADNPSFTEAGTYVVYFTVEADGYEPTSIMSEVVQIDLREVTLKSASDEKIYDGEELKTNEVVVVSGQLVAGQELVYECTGSQKNVGTNDNTFTVRIVDAADKTKDYKNNYFVAYENGKLAVTPRTVTIKFTANDKVYDGTTDATLKSTNFVNVVGGESLEFSAAEMSFAFDSADVGNGKTVTATGYTDDLIVAGPNTLKSNYTFSFTSTTAANITKSPTNPKTPEEEREPEEDPTPDNPGDTEEPTDPGDGTAILWAPDLAKYYDGEGTNTEAKVFFAKPDGYDSFTYEYTTNADLTGWTENLLFTNVLTDVTGKVVPYKVYCRATDNAGNYDPTNYVAYVTILPKEVDPDAGIIANNATMTYGKPKSITDIDKVGYTGPAAGVLVDGDGIASVSLVYTNTTDGVLAKLPVNADGYAGWVTTNGEDAIVITNATGDVTANYAMTFTPGKLIVDAGEFSFTLDGYEGAYDGAVHKVDISSDTVLPPDSTVWYSTDGGSTWTKDIAPTFKDVTNVTVSVKVTNPNYGEKSGSKLMNIWQREITLISPTPAPWSYDGKEHGFTKAEITTGGSNYADGECFDYDELATITEKGSKDATFVAKDSATAKLSNYNISYQYGKLTVTAAKDELGVKSLSGEWEYDGLPHSAGWEPMNSNNLIAGDAFDAKLEGKTVTTPDDGVVTNTFEYARILRDGKTDVTENYAGFIVITGTLKVVNANFKDVKALPVVKTYDGLPTGITVTVGDLLAKNHTIQYSLTGENGPWQTENPSFTNAVNEAKVWYKVSAQYFNDHIASTTVTINKRKVTFESQDSDKVYDESPLFTDVDKIDHTGLVKGEEDGISYAELASVTDVTEGDGVAAEFKAVFDGEKALESNYDISYKFGRLRINPAGVLTVRADSHEFAYGDGDCTWHEIASKTGLMPGHGIMEVTFAATSHIAKPSEGPVDNIITDIVITNDVGIVEHSVYEDIVFEKGQLTMKKGSLEGLVKAEDVVKIYDAVKTNITVDIDRSQLVDPSATAKIQYHTSAEEPLSLMNPSFINWTDSTVLYQVEIPEYELFQGQATVKINLRPLVIRSVDASKDYDGKALVSNKVEILSGTLADGDSAETKEYLSFTCTGSQTDVGSSENSYTYAVTNRNGTADLKRNYSINPQYGILKIEPAKFVYKPETYNGPYDNHDHFVQIPKEQIEKLPAGAKVTYSTDGVNWTVKPEDLKGHDVTNFIVYVKIEAPNYATETVPVTLNIYKRQLTLEGPNKNKAYDGSALTFDGSEIKDGGQKYADGECFLYSDFASITEIGETASLFKIADNPANGTKQSNYDVTIIKDRYLTVTPQANQIVVRSLSATKPYDGYPLTAGWEAENLNNLAEGDGLDVRIAAKSFALTPEDGIVTNEFEYVEITNATGKVTENYTNLVIRIGTLQVVNADFDEVKADPIVKMYDGIETNIDVRVTDPVAKNIKIRYSLDGEAFAETIEPFLHACDETTVWYEVTADYFNAVTNSTTVKINKRKLVYQSGDDSKYADGKPLTTKLETIKLVEEESDGLINPDEVSFTATGSAIKVEDSPADASFTVSFTQGQASDYAVETRFGKLYIYQTGGLTLIAGSTNFVFNGESKTYPKYEAIGLIDDDRIASCTVVGTISHPKESPVKNVIDRESVVIVDKDGKPVDPGKYAGFATIDGTLTMAPAKLADKVSSEGAEKTYDGIATNITVTVKYDEIVEASKSTVKILYSISPNGPFVEGNPVFSEAGTYDVYFKAEADGYETTPVMHEQITIGLRNVKLVSVGDSKAYDGTPLMTNEVKVVVEGEFLALATDDVLAYACTSWQTDVGESDNEFTCAITNSVTKYDVKNNYFVTYGYGKLVVTPADQEEEDPDQPEGALTPYDYIGVYDGAGHSINPFTVTKPAEGAVLYFSTNATDWVKSVDNAVPVQFFETNVCSLVKVYFKSVAPNYNDVVTNGYITITQRVVEVTSQGGTWTYDGLAHGTNEVYVSNGSFVAGEGISTNSFTTITDVGTADNTFEVTWNDNTLESNYAFSKQYGTLKIVEGAITPKNPKEKGPEDDYPQENPEDDPSKDPSCTEPTIWAQNIVKVYDGFGTNITAQVYNVGNETTDTFTYEYTTNKNDGTSWASDILFTNVLYKEDGSLDSYKVWYRAEPNDGCNYLGTNCYAYVTILPAKMSFGPDDNGDNHDQDPDNLKKPNAYTDVSGTSNGVKNVFAEWHDGISTNIIVNVVRPTEGVEIVYGTNSVDGTEIIWVGEDLAFTMPVLSNQVWYAVSAPNYQSITNYGYVTLYRAEGDVPERSDVDVSDDTKELLEESARRDQGKDEHPYVKIQMTIVETNNLSGATRTSPERAAEEAAALIALAEQGGTKVTYSKFYDVILERTYNPVVAMAEEYDWEAWESIGEADKHPLVDEDEPRPLLEIKLPFDEQEGKAFMGVWVSHMKDEGYMKERVPLREGADVENPLVEYFEYDKDARGDDGRPYVTIHVRNFSIYGLLFTDAIAKFTATVDWEYYSGNWIAKLDVRNTNTSDGFDYVENSMRFVFDERSSTNATTKATLWNPETHLAQTNSTLNGVEYPTTSIADPEGGWRAHVGDTVHYGPADGASAKEKVLSMRTTPVIRAANTYDTTLLAGWLVWESNGKTYSSPIVSNPDMARTLAEIMPEPIEGAPLSVEELDLAIQLGEPITKSDEVLGCRFTAFSISNDVEGVEWIYGQIAITKGTEDLVMTKEKLEKITVKLLWADDLMNEFKPVDGFNHEALHFEFEKPKADAKFYKASVETRETVVQ